MTRDEAKAMAAVMVDQVADAMGADIVSVQVVLVGANSKTLFTGFMSPGEVFDVDDLSRELKDLKDRSPEGVRKYFEKYGPKPAN